MIDAMLNYLHARAEVPVQRLRRRGSVFQCPLFVRAMKAGLLLHWNPRYIENAGKVYINLLNEDERRGFVGLLLSMKEGKWFKNSLGSEMIPFSVIKEYYDVVSDQVGLTDIHALVAYAFQKYGIKGDGEKSLRPYAFFHVDGRGQVAYFVLNN